MGKIDHKTVKGLELYAPGASTVDAKYLRSEVLEGRLFSAFSRPERVGIWSRLRMVDGLIPFLFTYFKDIRYLELCNDCVKRLVSVSSRQDVYFALRNKYTGVNQVEGQVKIQVTEDSFKYGRGTHENSIDMGCRGLNAFAMRNYPDIPREVVAKDPLKKPIARADNAVLRRYADLASELGFVSPEITKLRQYPCSTAVVADYPRASPPLVTPGPGVARAKRCGIPRNRAYDEDRGSLFINHLHDGRQDQGEGITSFFVRRSVYFAFFGRPATTPANGHSTGGQGSGDSPGSSSLDSTQSESTTPSPLTTSDDGDFIMTYYGRTSQSQGEGIDDETDASGSDQNQASEKQLELEQEQTRLEQEVLEQGQKRLGQELKRLEKVRLDQEQEQERLEQERERLKDAEKRLKDAEKRLEQEQKRLEQERLKGERQAGQINFMVRDGRSWKNLTTFYPTDGNQIETYVKTKMRNGFRAFNTELLLLSPDECYKTVIDDMTHTILLVSERGGLSIDYEMLKSAAEIRVKAIEMTRRFESVI